MASTVRQRSGLVQYLAAGIRQRRTRCLAADPDGCEPPRADRIPQDVVDVAPEYMLAPIVNDPSAYAIVLWLFTALLVGRVLGQLIVAVRPPNWLPPMQQWQSGL